MRATRARGNSGFTFVELLIVGIVVVLVVNGVAFALASSGRNIWARTNSQIEVLATAQRAMDRVTGELRTASAGSLVCAGEQLTFGRDTDGDQVIDQTVVYSRNTTARTLVRAVNGGAPATMTSDISGFTPTCQAGGLVRIRLTAGVALDTQTLTQPLSVNVWVKNP